MSEKYAIQNGRHRVLQKSYDKMFFFFFCVKHFIICLFNVK